MAGRRQQRTVNNRGQVQRPNVFPINVIPWQLLITDSTHATISANTGGRSLLGIGLLQLLAGSTHLAPSSMTIVGAQVNLVYPSPVAFPGVWTLDAGDPGIRTKDGSYLAPIYEQVTQFPWPPPAPEVVDWDITSLVGSVCTMQPETGTGLSGWGGLPDFYNVTTGNTVLSATQSSTNIEIVFNGSITSGDVIRYGQTVSNTITAEGKLWKKQERFVP